MTKILLSRWAFAVLATALALAAIILAVTPTAPRASAAPPATPGDQAKLTASDRAVDDFFGSTVAISGDTALVGAPQKFGVREKGSAYVFVGSGTAWNQQDQLAPSDGEVDDRFGFSVAVSGETAVVGASNDDGKGSVYVFVRSGSTWSQQAKLTASDGVPGSLDNFGADVAISGNTVVVGAQFNNGARGAAYVFVRSGSTWSQQAKLTASDATPIDVFGASVSISGNTVVAGAFLDDDKGTDSGSAYIFVRSGTTWSRQAKVKASDGASGDLFGVSVGVSGETVVVGSYLDDARGDNSGSAYVFKRDGTTWSQQAKFNAIDAASGDLFGTSVAVSGDTAVVGASDDDNNRGLSSYV